MTTRKINTVTERVGVNYIRTLVEENNSIFKEQDVRHDYGHDAFVLLVEGEQVLPKEIAMQIKSGASYCTPTSCKIPATAAQLSFWANHDMDTLGVVYDPSENTAYWVDLKAEAKERTRGTHTNAGAVIEYLKSPWNRLDSRMFREFLVPTLQHKAPLIDLKTAIDWAESEDFDTHDIGVRILSHRHFREWDAWHTMWDIFDKRDARATTGRIGIALVKMIGHHDDYGSYSSASSELRKYVVEKILAFGTREMAKLLFYVDDYGFERPSNGYSLLAVFAARHDFPKLFSAIRDDPKMDEETKDKAELLLRFYDEDPHFFRFWHKDGK